MKHLLIYPLFVLVSQAPIVSNPQLIMLKLLSTHHP
jgi:hypothetical protein